MQPTVAFHTLGCKLNFAETSTIGRQLREAGFRKVDFDGAADLYVINTCSVTENADRECRQLVRKATNSNPDAFIAVIGCYAQLQPQEIASIEGVDLVLGANEKFNLPSFLGDLNKKGRTEIHSCEITSLESFNPSHSAGDRTRSFLKVQDGCDYTCSYCTIPFARGKSRSGTVEQTVAAAMELAKDGVREIVLTGVNIGDFGHQPGDGGKKPVQDFLALIEALDRVTGIERFRISSIEPNLLSDDIIRFVASSRRFVPHFHVPLQSGSDRILKAMRRRYLRALYAERVAHIRSVLPDACIGVDVIVGFPGETEDDFNETFDFISGLEVSYLHVFTYSERENTDAAVMAGSVPMEVRKQRNKRLRLLSQKLEHQFYRSHLGSIRSVLFEDQVRDGLLFGHTDNYIKVGIPVSLASPGMSCEVLLEQIDEQGRMKGRLIEQVVEIPSVSHHRSLSDQ